VGARRAFDLLVGIPAAIAATPIVAVLAVVVVVTSGPPVFLIQERVGARERRIRVVKFRTMRRGTPVVAKSDLKDADRVLTPPGRFLRRTSLDELPQLWNVLRGEMSLVGPRPALPSQRDLIALRRKHGVLPLKPGITGLAQVLGRESLTLSTKVRAEALYARRASIRLDLLILLWTARAVVFGRGAY
jgi:O-antigen biosynthesis protein WbqP